jgi:hypothetical protein
VENSSYPTRFSRLYHYCIYPGASIIDPAAWHVDPITSASGPRDSVACSEHPNAALYRHHIAPSHWGIQGGTVTLRVWAIACYGPCRTHSIRWCRLQQICARPNLVQLYTKYSSSVLLGWPVILYTPVIAPAAKNNYGIGVFCLTRHRGVRPESNEVRKSSIRPILRGDPASSRITHARNRHDRILINDDRAWFVVQ